MKTQSTSRAAFFNSRLLTGFALCSVGLLLALAGLSKSVTGLIAATPDPNTHHQHHHYKLIDMGTFGGHESAINFAVDDNDRSVNKRGVTVGFSATSTHKLPQSHPLICGGDDGYGSFITHAFRWQDGTVIDLGALPPAETNCSNTYQVNANGQIAGFSENGQIDPLLGFNQSRAVRWKDGEIEDLGSFGGNQNGAIAINNRGQIVGNSQNATPDPFSCWGPTSTECRAFLWQDGVMRDLGTLGGNDADAVYINERGQVAGVSYTSTIPNPVTGVPPIDPFLWENGTMLDLGTLGGAVGSASGLNNRGQVIGLSSVAANPGACFTEFDPDCHPFFWNHGTLIDLNTSTIGGIPQIADGINDVGEIVGAAAFPTQVYDAYLWRNGSATDLGHLTGDCYSEGFAINTHGQMAGNSFSCQTEFNNNFHHGFLWENGSIVDLNALIPADSPLQLVAAADINDRGEIAGLGVPPGVDPHKAFIRGHAFLLIPCDENHPSVEGCDYSLVEASAAPSAGPAVRKAFGHMPRASLWRRDNRFHFPTFGPRN
jgi:probable HAF family extracellular repeat protein